ncbi:MAG: excalibur calcium-binding domain-containing protein [Spirulinaceae cyanobacterium]
MIPKILAAISILGIIFLSSSQPQIPPALAQTTNCDPAYPDPDVCIPSPPPDLDCGEIEYRNFTVLPPDPHRFDGDKDGIGCEKR